MSSFVLNVITSDYIRTLSSNFFVMMLRMKCYRAAMGDVTSVMKSFPWGKTVWISYGKRAFSLLHVC